jgi:predicted dehydrogenase
MNRAKRLFSKNPTSSSAPDPQYALPNLPPPRPPFSANPPRILIIGAGSRGSACAHAIMMASNGRVVAVAEPVEFKRKKFGERFIWGIDPPQEGMEFEGWESFKEWELNRRLKEKNGEQVPKGVDGVLVCTLDHTHADIITALAPLNLHLLSEKPLATNLEDCLRIYASLAPKRVSNPTALFGVGHVMRYSSFNILLRKLLLEDEAIGDIIAIEHTEPVGWWHFSHSYVRWVSTKYPMTC